MNKKSVIFDLGNVLIRWDPKRLLKTLYDSHEQIDQFLTETSFSHWNEKLDAGVQFSELIPRLKRAHPNHAHAIEAYQMRWDETLVGPIEESVRVLRSLHGQGVPLYALTNWSAETFPHALRRFDFLRLFRGILVSGEEKLIKPDPRIYARLVEKFHLRAKDLFFTDDLEANCQGARDAGMVAHRFESASALSVAVEQFLGERLALDKHERP
jgi:2-haloacid dehalogenase